MNIKTTDPDKFFLKNLVPFIGYVNSNQILPMILLLAAGSVFTLLPLILGFIAFFVLYALAYKLAVDVLIETANGNMIPGDFQSSFEAKDILLKFIIVGLIQNGILIWLKFFAHDPLLLISYIFVSTFLTPAIFMVLSITNSIASALNPLTIIRLIKPFVFSYLCFVLFWLLLEFIQTYGIEPLVMKLLPELFAGIVSSFFKFFILILNFHIMGFLIFQNRNSFGLETDFDDENDDELNIESPAVNPIHQRIKKLLLAGNITQASVIITEIKSQGDNSDELLALEKQVQEMSLDTPTKPLTTAETIHKLITENKIGMAFKAYNQTRLDNKKYIEKDPKDINFLAQYAYDSEKYQMVATLVNFFHNKYPNHEDIVANYFLLVQVLYKGQASKQKAKSMLKNLIKKYPNHKLVTRLSSWLKGIELLERK